VRAEAGDHAASEALLREGIVHDRDAKFASGESSKHLALAYLRYRAGDLEAARNHCSRAMALETSPHRVVLAAAVLARAGFPSDAEALLRAVEGPERIFEAARLRIAGEVLAARGRLPEAIAAFRKADAIEPPADPREYLARALARAGDRRGALALYRRLVESHNRIWIAPETKFPGLLADALLQSAVLAQSTGDAEQARSAAARLLALTAGSTVRTRDIEAARRILDRAEQ
jgi:tetratricopeptide (TPR) repeat protein